MSKKLMMSIAPVLVIAAFAVMPAMASANTEAYGTVTGGVFTPFAGPTNVLSEKTPGSGNFVLKTAGGGVIECATFEDKGVNENVGGVGMSKDALVFDDCVVAAGPAAGCEVANIEGTVENEVLAGGVKVGIFNLVGFVVSLTGKPVGCPEGIIGQVTLEKEATEVVGNQAEGSNALVFEEAPGLEFNKEKATITGSDSTVTEVGGEPVLIN